MHGSHAFSGAVSFVAMWTVMMAAMMLPSLVPMLRRYRQAVGRIGGRRRMLLTAIVAVGYFVVWTLIGIVLYPLGAARAAIGMQHHLTDTIPIAAGVVAAAAGVVQLTAWKARRLACCREAAATGRRLQSDAGTAWRHGVRLGLDCLYCCGNLMAIVLVVGVMDLRAMTLVAAAITAERIAPAGQRIARGTGVILIAVGVLAIGRSAHG